MTPRRTAPAATAETAVGALDLSRYRAKRDFRQSPEPSGDGPSGPGAESGASHWNALGRGHRFCVQLHRASRLHYDFRLEYRGVLLSWAVPKGPSIDPKQRRLAVQVEDHPVDYGSFEGVIPSGYGAGTVLLWDLGHFRWTRGPKGGPARGLREGHLDFELEGQCLSGAFSLIRMDHPKDGKQAEWLLMKRADQGVHATDRTAETTSVETGRSLDQVAAGTSPAPGAGPDAPGLVPGAPKGHPPTDLSPMLATLVRAPFSDPDWLFELKYDGVRALVTKSKSEVRVQGRSGRDETLRYPELQALSHSLSSRDCVIDGEIVVLDAGGAPNFSRLQRRIQLSPSEAQRATEENPVVLMAFDILFADGHDLRSLPLRQRKQILRAILSDSPAARYADDVEGAGESLYQTVRQRGLEGVMAKRCSSPYQSGKRSPWWLKIKVRPTQDCLICGYAPGKGRRSGLGALILGVYAEGELVEAGRLGTGFSDRMVTQLKEELDRRRRARSPFQHPTERGAGLVWAEPELVCEVEHAGWTACQRLRQPSFRALRPDVPPSACIREEPSSTIPSAPGPAGRGASPAAPAPSPGDGAPTPEVLEAIGKLAELPPRGGLLQVGPRQLRVTNLDKVLWPREGITKRELIAYHLQVSKVLLPHLRDRAVVLQLFPDGIEGKSFWRRALPASAPSWIPRWEATPGEPTICPLIQEPAALAWIANLGAIEIHPWHSRRDRPTQPDWAVFDLDPGADTPFQEVIEVAQLVKAGLDHLGVEGLLKTTGQKGLHIYVPIRRGPQQAAVRDWVGEFAHQIAVAAPKLVTEDWAVRARQGRIRIDYTQNVVGKMLAAAYSPRPSAGAGVSTPLEWSELDQLDPAAFNLRTIWGRIASRGDLFAGALSGGQRLPKLGSEPGTRVHQAPPQQSRRK